MSDPVVILYATTEGHTRTIAEHVMEGLAQRGVSSRTYDVSDAGAVAALEASSAAILASSIHVGRHQRRFVDFVIEHRDLLDARTTLMLAISLSASELDQQGQQKTAQFQRLFEEQTGWHPDHWAAVGGALRYTRYGFFKRWIIRRIAKEGGLDTDTSRDHVYTDWAALDARIEGFSRALQPALATG
jgi:menaquinone-dependent protoporphyrinogen oxidase